MVPETTKTIILGTFASAASLKLPGPLSLRLFTMKTFPPLPPVVYFPNPSAPGKAIGFSGWLDELSFDCCPQETRAIHKTQNNIKETFSIGFFGPIIIINCKYPRTDCLPPSPLPPRREGGRH